MPVRDVVVIGAGPAGSMAARRLAEQGRDVVLVEEHDAVGSPVHCTGLLGAEAFDEFDLPKDVILGEARSARFWGASGESVAVASDRIRAVVIERALLDARLAARAEAAGAELRCGWRARSVVVGDRSVRVTGGEGDDAIDARACVLACGANYRFHRRLGFGLPALFLQSAQLETPFPALPEIEVRFGRDLAPGGFAWLVPFRRAGVAHARIGLMTENRGADRFAVLLDSLGQRDGLQPADGCRPRLRALPLGPVPRTYGDRVIAVGDAAGLVKPTTGGGIYYGLLTGALAAEVLDRALRTDRLRAADLQRYEGRWRRRLGQEIRVGLAFRRIAARLTDESIVSLIQLARVNGIAPLLQEKASFNWHRKAAIALLAHSSFRAIVLKSWRGTANLT
jgi:geranylgeranyl reductase family protein